MSNERLKVRYVGNAIKNYFKDNRLVIFLQIVSKDIRVHQRLSTLAQNVHSLFQELDLKKYRNDYFTAIQIFFKSLFFAIPLSKTYCAAAFLPFSLLRLRNACAPDVETACDSCNDYSKRDNAAVLLLSVPEHRELREPRLHHTDCNCT